MESVPAMDPSEETDPLNDVESTSKEEKTNPVIDDELLSLLHQDFAQEHEQRCDVVEEDIDPAPDPAGDKAPQHVKATEKNYECPHCDFVATGHDNIKLYEEAVRHKKSFRHIYFNTQGIEVHFFLHNLE